MQYLDKNGLQEVAKRLDSKYMSSKIGTTEIFPVGYIYLSTDSTNPGTYFGGTWEQINGGIFASSEDGTEKIYIWKRIEGEKLSVNGIDWVGYENAETKKY